MGFGGRIRSVDALPCGDGNILHCTAVCIAVTNGSVLSYCVLSFWYLQGDVRALDLYCTVLAVTTARLYHHALPHGITIMHCDVRPSCTILLFGVSLEADL